MPDIVSKIILSVVLGYFVKEFFGPTINQIATGISDECYKYVIRVYNSLKYPKLRNVLVNVPGVEQGKFKMNFKYVPGRDMDSLIIPKEAHELFITLKHFLNDVTNTNFGSNNYGVLLYGPPGNGKSQYIKALSTELGIPLNALTLSSVFLGDESIRTKVFSSFTEKSIVLIEDADAIFETRIVKDGKLNLDTLLSGIDGPFVTQNIIYILSCNNKDLLPRKLKRRFPHEILFDNPTVDEAELLYQLYFPNATDEDIEDFRSIFAECSEISYSDIEGCYKRVKFSPQNEQQEKFIVELEILSNRANIEEQIEN